MSDTRIRPAYSSWPEIDRRLREAVASLSAEQLSIQPTPDRWPIWASLGHLACQRVFWLCDFAGAPGAATSPFPDAGNNCPGDDDLEHVWSAAELAGALEATFRIVDRCLDAWTIASLEEVIRHPEWGDDWVHTRGAAIQRVFAHDVSHITELNETLSAAGLPIVDLWV
jgi:uncharacterized damage-inducible protein DinB